MSSSRALVIGIARTVTETEAAMAGRLVECGLRLVVDAPDALADRPELDALVLDLPALDALGIEGLAALTGAGATHPRPVFLWAPAETSVEAIVAAEARGISDWLSPEASPGEWRRRLVAGCARARRRRDEAEAQSRQSHMLADVQRAARLGCFVYTTADDHCVATEALQRLLGLPSDHPAGQETFLERVHPADRDRMVAAAQRAVVGGVPVEIEHRLCPADRDEVLWALTVIEVERNADGTPRVFKGISQDVTDRHRWGRELLQARARSPAVRAPVPARTSVASGSPALRATPPAYAFDG